MSTQARCLVAGILLTAVTLLAFSSWTLQRQIQEFDRLNLRGGGSSASPSPSARPIVYIPDLSVVDDPAIPPRAVSAEEAATLAKLQRKVPMQFESETPLREVLLYIKSATRDGKDDHDLPIYIDPVALHEAEKTLESPVTLNLSGMPLATTLKLLLGQLGLYYRVQDDGLISVKALAGDTEQPEPLQSVAGQLYHLRCEVAALRGELAAARGGMEVKETAAAGSTGGVFAGMCIQGPVPIMAGSGTWKPNPMTAGGLR